MISKNYFIKATEEYNTFEKNLPAYYFRRAFNSETSVTVKVTVAVCGFYELFFNGERITRGFLSPYISNTDDLIYYDEYEITLRKGENVFGVLLGNGFQNNPGGYIWKFDEAAFRSAPMLALSVTREDEVLLHSGEGFRIAPSPIRSDDYRFGEYYDANYETDGWNRIGFDDSAWDTALPAVPPKGELRIADIAPIVKETEIEPVDIIPCEDGGYIYDFGISNAGVCSLCVSGEKGQKIELRHADSLKDGDLNLAQIWFRRDQWERDSQIVHRDTYICRGEG
ncbi:MAG: family 78 glycoside hydrolase catalytic domain, partial [Clostridia bacterium]|nr:family 78 glycoside hydrolase catalytic domain [Clostridia bacterium]